MASKWDAFFLGSEILDAVMVAGGAHQKLSKQALGSEEIREGIKKILLGPARLYETLREGLECEKAL